MSLLNKMVSFFLEEDTPKPKSTQKEPESVQKKSVSMLKGMFTKTDPFILTEFPYHWEKDFFPPLDDKERKYMRTEIMRWYALYYETNYNILVETLVEGAIEEGDDEVCAYFEEEYPEEFRLMIQNVLDDDFITITNEKILTYDGADLIRWKPEQGELSWQPPTSELLELLTNLLMKVKAYAKENLKVQIEQENRLKEIKGRTAPTSAKAKALSDYVVTFLEKHRGEITKHAFDRTILELNAFPSYYGQYEKEFRNELFFKYREDFGVSSYNELTASAFVLIQPFLKANGKMELKRWYNSQWDEFVDFMKNEYLHLNEGALEDVHADELNLFALAIDFYALTLFKLHLDGM